MIRRLLTLLVALHLTLAPMAQAGVQTVAYGGNFGDAFKGAFINSVVALGLADAQTGIGGVFAKEGSGGGLLRYAESAGAGQRQHRCGLSGGLQ